MRQARFQLLTGVLEITVTDIAGTYWTTLLSSSHWFTQILTIDSWRHQENGQTPHSAQLG